MTSWMRVVCAVAFLAAAGARAQSTPPATLDAVPRTGTPEDERERAAPPGATRALPPPSARAVPPLIRIGTETGAGIVGGAVLGGASAWTLWSTLGSPDTSDDSRKVAAQVGAALGVSVGAPIGVSLAGTLLERRGSFIVSWLSSVVGLGVGYGIYGLVRSGSDSSVAKGTYALTLLLPVAGAVVGYELSAPLAEPGASVPESGGAARIVPAFALGPAGGGMVGLAGRF